MIRTLVRRLAIGVFILYALAITWPVASHFNTAEPLILGLPFSMAWPVAWILIGLITLLVLDYFENRDRDE